MKHHMNLRLTPFDMIRSGQKTIELRLYDEKRREIRVGDEIEFDCLDKDATPIAVRVMNIYRFDNFDALYATLPLLKCGYNKNTIVNAAPSDMNQYYSIEEQEQFGVVGIEIELA